MPTYYKFNYALRNETGEVVDSSEAAEALFFVEGDGSMIPGLEKAVTGRDVGDEFAITIGPEDAYGWPQRQLVRTVSRDMIQSDAEEIEAGMIFQIGSGEESQVVKVVSIESDGITIDGNHPLAGITFNFDVHVIEVREATEADM
jgi:FKBP-type peptidyl-prolyl cis-trans isomerase SlyD